MSDRVTDAFSQTYAEARARFLPAGWGKRPRLACP